MPQERTATNFVCSCCSSNPAMSFCLCQQPILYLCANCAELHQVKCRFHRISLGSKSHAAEELAASFSAERRASCFAQLHHSLRLSSLSLEDYRAFLDRTKANLLQEIESWYSTACQDLSSLTVNCGVYTEMITEKLNRMQSGETPTDEFEETLRKVDSTEVERLCGLVNFVDFEAAELSISPLLSSLPSPTLTVPESIGRKQLTLLYESRQIPITVRNETTQELVELITRNISLQEPPTITLQDGQILNQGNCNITSIAHGSVLTVDCGVRVKVIWEDKELQVLLTSKDTVKSLKYQLSKCWCLDHCRLNLSHFDQSLPDNYTFSHFPSNSTILCTVLSTVFLKPKQGFRRLEVQFTENEKTADLRARAQLPMCTELFFGLRKLDDLSSLSAQGLTHLSVLTFDPTASSAVELQLVLLSGKRKSVKLQHLHIRLHSVHKQIVDQLGTAETLRFVFDGRTVKEEEYLDEVGVRAKSTIRIYKD